MGTPPPIELANLGMADSLILMVLALVVFGPRRLPQIGRQIGKLMYEFRKASNDFKYQMEEELRSAEEADRRRQEEERLRALALAAPATPALETPQAAAPATAESPYPEEAVYPAVAAAAAETQPEETYPRIQPPSTGEPVPAARPNRLEAQVNAQPEAASENGAGAEQKPSSDADLAAVAEGGPAPDAVPALAERGSPVTEQAAHHG